MKATTKKSSRAPRYSKSFFEQDDKEKAEQLALNVPELMATSNTLTHPDNFQDRQKRRAEELWSPSILINERRMYEKGVQLMLVK